MESVAGSVQHFEERLGKARELYSAHNYLDAWEASRDDWSLSFNPDLLTADSLVFAGRLALRVGGHRLSRSLLLRARKLYPNVPVVRYFTHHLVVPRQSLLDELRAFEAAPDLGGDDLALRASWLATYAVTWASLQNFERTTELLDEANRLLPNDSWILGCQSDCLGLAEDWKGSLETAEESYRLDPRSPWAAPRLSTALLNLGKVEEAAQKIVCAATEGQSCELVLAALWYQCALAEVLDGKARVEALATTRSLAGRLEPLAPLGDRDYRTMTARVWLDIAQLDGDRAAMAHWSQFARSPFHRSVLENLRKNPNGKRVVLAYKRLLQKTSECVPTSAASALSTMGVNLSVAEIARVITFGGSAEWAATDWLRGKGLHTRFFTATVDVASRLIDAGIGFVIIWENDDSGHAVAIVGIDHSAGILHAHDPQSFRGTQYLFRALDSNAGPIGVIGWAAVPAERAQELDALLPPEAELASLLNDHRKVLFVHGAAAGRAIVAAAQKSFPGHPGALYLSASQDLEEGRMGGALRKFRTLFEMFPNSAVVRKRLSDVCLATGNTALRREVLRSIVESHAVPGVDSQIEWIRPHYRYLSELADLLRSSSETQPEATILLRSALRANPRSGGIWHSVGDLCFARGDKEGALLAFSIASFLAPYQEHFAAAYKDLLHRAGRAEQALRWMDHRVKRFGDNPFGVSTWMALANEYEAAGQPQTAIEVCREAICRHPSSAPLQAFCAPLLARLGLWDESEELLNALSHGPSRGEFLEAAAILSEMQGKTAQALLQAEEWCREAPRSMRARSTLLSNLAKVEGTPAAVARAAAWMKEFPDNENFESLYCDYARNWKRWRELIVVRRRLRRFPDDAWAWRELAIAAIERFELLEAARQPRLAARIEDYLLQASVIAPDDAATIRVSAIWSQAKRDWKFALAQFLRSIELEPANIYSFRRIWNVSERCSREEQEQLWKKLEAIYLAIPGSLPNAPEIAGLLASRFGVREAETSANSWMAQRPNDPNVIEAIADLLLAHGRGRSDAQRALEFLQPAVLRFPYHSGLRFSLARAWSEIGDHDEAKRAFRDLISHIPNNTSALLQLAWIEQRSGNLDDALRILDAVNSQDPQMTQPHETKAEMLMTAGRNAEARAVLHRGLELLPRNVRMIERTIALFERMGMHSEAVDAARRGVVEFPDGAYLWLLLAKTLQNNPQFASPGEIEGGLTKSVRLNRSFYEPADMLACLYSDQQRFSEAIELLNRVEPRLANPTPAKGRRAWLKRNSGLREEAVDDLAEILRDQPGYTWGWNLLLTWLEEDKNWTLARSILETVPPQLVADVSFRTRRTLLLEQAKIDSLVLEAEWKQLLADFPENLDLHLRRYDMLSKAQRLVEADSILRSLPQASAKNVFVQARMVEVELHAKNETASFEAALSICFPQTEPGVWPCNFVWDRLSGAGLTEKFEDQFFLRLESGKRPARQALSRFTGSVLQRKSGAPRWLKRTRLSFAYRRMRKILEILERSSWSNGEDFAAVFASLNGNHLQALVVECWNRNPGQKLHASGAAWGQVGRALVGLGRKRAARQLLSDWHQRQGS
jgi:tetratricopeptide (TPR) repeat protein